MWESGRVWDFWLGISASTLLNRLGPLQTVEAAPMGEGDCSKSTGNGVQILLAERVALHPNRRRRRATAQHPHHTLKHPSHPTPPEGIPIAIRFASSLTQLDVILVKASLSWRAGCWLQVLQEVCK